MFPSLVHLASLTDDVGTIQHAFGTLPNRATGYCTDDIARAAIVAIAHQSLDPSDPHAERIAHSSLAFLLHAQLPDGRFHNFMSYGREWLDDVGTEDSCGRALWALGYARKHARNSDWRERCAVAFERGLAKVNAFTHLRPTAYAALGVAAAGERGAVAAALLARLRDALAANAEGDWDWYESRMTYDNARLPQAHLLLADLLGDAEARKAALAALAFYRSQNFEGELFSPVGNRGWLLRGGTRARFDQQPLEAAAAVDAFLAADRAGVPGARADAERALQWFHGRNVLGVALVDDRGGCSDGVDEDGINANRGAESTLAYLMATQTWELS
ncbi:MAG: hypothetical protein ACP5O6_04610 [Candidatus Baltobacteraceae bacterium]